MSELHTNTDTDADKYILNGVEVTSAEVIVIMTNFLEAQRYRMGILRARIAEMEGEVTKGHELQDSYCDRIAELEEKVWNLNLANEKLESAYFADETIAPDGTLKPSVRKLLERLEKANTDCNLAESHVTAMLNRIAELEAENDILKDQQREAKNILIDKNLHIDSLYEEGYKMQQRIAELSQAVGLITTLKPTMVMDTDHPLDMAKEVEVYVTARIAELEAETAMLKQLSQPIEFWSDEKIQIYKSNESRTIKSGNEEREE